MEYLGCICALCTCRRNMDDVPACRHVGSLVINGVISLIIYPSKRV